MPYKDETYTFTLDAVGCPELTVEAIDPDSIDAGERDRIVQAMAVLSYAEAKGEPLGEKDRWVLRAVEDFARRSIVSWNLPYPRRHAEAGKVIPLATPDEPDVNPLAALPGYVYKAVVGEVAGRLMSPPKSA